MTKAMWEWQGQTAREGMEVALDTGALRSEDISHSKPQHIYQSSQPILHRPAVCHSDVEVVFMPVNVSLECSSSGSHFVSALLPCLFRLLVLPLVPRFPSIRIL